MLSGWTRKFDVSGDFASFNSFRSKLSLENELQQILENYEDDIAMKFVDNQNGLNTKEMLTKLKSRLSRERKAMLAGNLRKSFRAKMKSQGYGRNAILRW